MMKTLVYAMAVATVTLSVSCKRSEDVARERGETTIQPAPGARTGEKAELSKSDKMFLDEAAKSGMLEVKLGELAAKQGAREEVKKLGQKMVDEHTKINTQLKQLAQKKNVAMPKDLDPAGQQTIDRISKLSGVQFDRACVSELVAEHTKAVSTFEMHAKEAKDPDVKAFATNTLPHLQTHLDEVKELRTKLSVAQR